MTAFSGFFLAFSVVNGINDLFPFESRLGVSDGKRIWMLLRQPLRGERWLALLQLGGELSDGVLPESLSADFLSKAVAVRDASEDTVKAYAIAFRPPSISTRTAKPPSGSKLSGVFQPCLASPPRSADERCRRVSSEEAEGADLAEQWLAEIPEKTQTTDNRPALGKLTYTVPVTSGQVSGP